MQPIYQKHDEMILVVPRSILIDAAWLGLKTDHVESYIKRIKDHKEFHPRSLMEQDESYKQIVSYMVFIHQDMIFLMQRKASASEQRLKNKLSIGIGGHLQQQDAQHDSLVAWVEREFKEEIHYQGALSYSLLGLVNDDTNAVGKVHAGLVFIIQGDSAEISIRSELKHGRLVTKDELMKHYHELESWSQFIADYLCTTSV